MLNYKNPNSLAAIDALILCGGVGSRLRPVISDRPKGLAPVHGRPFLDILVEDLTQQGFRRIIFCVGHFKEQIIARYQARNDAEYLFSRENVPLGTGGAVQNALPLIRSNTFLVMNGDSRCHIDFSEFYQFHLDKAAEVSFVLTESKNRHDGGAVSIDRTQQVSRFSEKPSPQAHKRLINAGIYLAQIDAMEIQNTPPPFSLEYDVFPVLVKTKPCFGFVIKSQLVDIGTPERYRKANENWRQ